MKGKYHPALRRNHTSELIGNELIIMLGISESNKILNDVYSLNLSFLDGKNEKWNEVHISKETIDRLCNISCEYVAERLGMVVQKHRTICFMHDDHHPSLSFFGKNRNFWHCFVCNKGLLIRMDKANLFVPTFCK